MGHPAVNTMSRDILLYPKETHMPIDLLKTFLSKLDTAEIAAGLAGVGSLWLVLQRLILQSKSISSEVDAVDTNDKVRHMLLEEVSRLSKVAKDNEELHSRLNSLILENVKLHQELRDLRDQLDEIKLKTCLVGSCTLRDGV